MTGAKGMLQPSCRTGVTPARLARDAGRTNGLAWAPKYPKGMNDEGIFPLRGLYPSAAWLRLLMFVKHPEILRRKGPVEWKVLLLLLWLWLLRLIYFIKALYYLIRCFKDKGPRKFANTDEVRLGSHLDGGERIVSSTPQLGKREQRVRCLAGGSLSAPGDRMGKSTQGFQTYFCPSKRKICRLCLLPCPRPSPVAVNFWCVKLWSGRKKKKFYIYNPGLFSSTRLTACKTVCALCGPGQARALFPQLDGSPIISGYVYFFPVRDYLNDKLAQFWMLTGRIKILAE